MLVNGVAGKKHHLIGHLRGIILGRRKFLSILLHFQDTLKSYSIFWRYSEIIFGLEKKGPKVVDLGHKNKTQHVPGVWAAKRRTEGLQGFLSSSQRFSVFTIYFGEFAFFLAQILPQRNCRVERESKVGVLANFTQFGPLFGRMTLALGVGRELGAKQR